VLFNLARLEVDIPDNIFERLASECQYSGEPMDSIIARALFLLFSQPSMADELSGHRRGNPGHPGPA
jgi:hypothetical protein